ncbi:MAG TPA: acyl-CoA thioesterase domain-containing protein [Acidimicrobiales bacterium]|nr:acyl-CoA thioesterase domain-containing protein [Acidimicrobiales bacterium]
MPDLAGFLAALELSPEADGAVQAGNTRFGATNMDNPGPVVFGGQMLAQVVAAAARSVPGQQVKSLHTVFARGASAEADLSLEADVMHGGRAFSSLTISLRQGERLCARSLVLMEAGAADLIRHAPPAPAGSPEEAAPAGHGAAGAPNGHGAAGAPNGHGAGAPNGHGAGAVDWWEMRMGEGADFADPGAVGPPRLDVWMRFPGAPDDPVVDRALLAYASDGFLIGAALRPHPGFGQSLAHIEFATTVLTHTLTFHEPFRASEWLLLAQEAPYAGRGRSYGRAHVFSEDGRLVASFVQEAMIRAQSESGPR